MDEFLKRRLSELRIKGNYMIHIRIHKPTPPLKGTGPMATITGYYTRQAI